MTIVRKYFEYLRQTSKGSWSCNLARTNIARKVPSARKLKHAVARSQGESECLFPRRSSAQRMNLSGLWRIGVERALQQEAIQCLNVSNNRYQLFLANSGVQNCCTPKNLAQSSTEIHPGFKAVTGIAVSKTHQRQKWGSANSKNWEGQGIELIVRRHTLCFLHYLCFNPISDWAV